MKRWNRSVDKHGLTWSWTLLVDQVAQQQTELALEAEEKLKKLQEEVHTAEEELATASWTADGRSYIEYKIRNKEIFIFSMFKWRFKTQLTECIGIIGYVNWQCPRLRYHNAWKSWVTSERTANFMRTASEGNWPNMVVRIGTVVICI